MARRFSLRHPVARTMRTESLSGVISVPNLIFRAQPGQFDKFTVLTTKYTQNSAAARPTSTSSQAHNTNYKTQPNSHLRLASVFPT